MLRDALLYGKSCVSKHAIRVFCQGYILSKYWAGSVADSRFHRILYIESLCLHDWEALSTCYICLHSSYIASLLRYHTSCDFTRYKYLIYTLQRPQSQTFPSLAESDSSRTSLSLSDISYRLHGSIRSIFSGIIMTRNRSEHLSWFVRHRSSLMHLTCCRE